VADLPHWTPDMELANGDRFILDGPRGPHLCAVRYEVLHDTTTIGQVYCARPYGACPDHPL
jgi:hypothetical protein